MTIGLPKISDKYKGNFSENQTFTFEFAFFTNIAIFLYKITFGRLILFIRRILSKQLLSGCTV